MMYYDQLKYLGMDVIKQTKYFHRLDYITIRYVNISIHISGSHLCYY